MNHLVKKKETLGGDYCLIFGKFPAVVLFADFNELSNSFIADLHTIKS
ncbi:MAG TPA: hypothetical protein VGR71_17105 [Nitrospira sp.]|nr:hypothetical protein [Nitrospira sp.]